MDFRSRKHPRLKHYDYALPGYYYVTIHNEKGAPLLSSVRQIATSNVALVVLTPIGKLAEQELLTLENRYPYVRIDKYVIMPNHIHLIVRIKPGGDGTPPLQVYDIIGRFKSFTNNKYDGVLWQRSFHDHIIRGEDDYLKIWNYIDTNAAKWQDDCFYVK